MNSLLYKILFDNYNYEKEMQAIDQVQAKNAFDEGDMPSYFDLSIHHYLADICFGLEKMEEAKYWYRHNANFLIEQHNWHIQNSGPNYPINASSDWIASTLIKAGNIKEGRKFLKIAIDYWKSRPNPQLVLTKLGLHSSQVGLPEFSNYVNLVIDARQELSKGLDDAGEKASALLHYEPAEVNLLLGKWKEFGENISDLEKAQQLIKKSSTLIFPEPMQKGLLYASTGFQLLAIFHSEKKGSEAKKKEAKDAFENAMIQFYEFNGHADSNLYFMRLNTLFIDEIINGQSLNTNPFADKSV